MTSGAQTAGVDLRCDVNTADDDLVVECWISHGPRANDPTFDPQPGDELTVSFDVEPPEPARVVRRAANRVWIQLRPLRPHHEGT